MSEETVQDTEAFVKNIYKSECMRRRKVKGKYDDHFLPYIYCLTASQSISFFCEVLSPVGKAHCQHQNSLHIYAQRCSACMLWLRQLCWVLFQWPSLLYMWNKNPHFNSNVLLLYRKPVLGGLSPSAKWPQWNVWPLNVLNENNPM